MPECIVDNTQYNLRCWCKYRVFTQNEEFAAYTGTDFYQKILQFVCAVCMAQHSCSLHLYVQFVWDACRLQYGCAIQIAHTNPELHKSCILHLYDILYVIHACDHIQIAHTKSWFLLSLLGSLEVVWEHRIRNTLNSNTDPAEFIRILTRAQVGGLA